MFSLPNKIDASLYFPQPQTDAPPAQADYRLVQSGHPGVVNVAMGDGSARGVSGNVSQPIWQSVIDPSDGLLLPPDW